PLCPEKKRIRHALLVEAMGKLVEMRDEEDLDALLQQRAGYLPSDLGALPLIRRREGFVEQNHAVRAQPVDDLAHPAELLVELSALHFRILFALEMREEALADIGRERRRGHEHAALHHQLRQADAAQEG